MSYTEASNKATQRYIKKAYDQFVVRVPKGDRDKYSKQAAKKGLSLNAYIIQLLNNDR